MQAVPFVASIVLSVLAIALMFDAHRMRGGQAWVRPLAFVATGLLVANVPWLMVCQWMRKRTERELAGMQAGCCRCGYALEGLADGAPCPECGRTPEERVKGRAWLERAVKKW